MNDEVGRPRAVPLPTTVEDMLAQRRTMAGRTLNDYVEDMHIKLWPNATYQRFLEAVYDEDAVEGSLAVDNIKAAEMIRDLAKEEKVPQVANRKAGNHRKSDECGAETLSHVPQGAGHDDRRSGDAELRYHRVKR